jgi:hypothetical protein
VQRGLVFPLILLLCLVTLPSPTRGDPDEPKTSDDVGTVPSPKNPEKIVIGEVEEVTLVPWGISLPARIDTGADISALDARNIRIWKNIADFRLGKSYGDLHLRLPIVEWRQVKTSVGSDTRPVVEIGICLGPKFLRTMALLGDRSQMAYPFLVGRNVLKGRFIVDASHAKAVHTVCPAGSFLGEESTSR